MTIAGETEELGENLPQRHFVPPQSHAAYFYITSRSVFISQPTIRRQTVLTAFYKNHKKKPISYDLMRMQTPVFS
jgi:hypothetical protein